MGLLVPAGLFAQDPSQRLQQFTIPFGVQGIAIAPDSSSVVVWGAESESVGNEGRPTALFYRVVNVSTRSMSTNTGQASANQSEQRSSLDRMRSLWFGGDLNQNYRLDPIEVQLLERLSRSERGAAPSSRPAANADSRWRPLQRYLTWTQGERNERRDGSPRIFLNQANLQQLHQQLTTILPVDLANFVIAYRFFGRTI